MRTLALVVVAWLVMTPTALAQDEQYEVVDAGVEDVGVLSTSLRQVDGGLQRPAGFEQVYRVPGFSNLFMRIDGGVFAVFNRSAYDASGPLIPSNTVFFIGPPSTDMLQHYAGQSLPTVVTAHGRLDTRLIDGETTPTDVFSRRREVAPARLGISTPAIATDTEYRRERLHELLSGVAARLK